MGTSSDYLPKRVVDFPRERDTFLIEIMEIVEDFNEKSYNNNGKPGIVEDFACEAKFLIFLFFFIIFLHLFSFFSFFQFFTFFHFFFFFIF